MYTLTSYSLIVQQISVYAIAPGCAGMTELDLTHLLSSKSNQLRSTSPIASYTCEWQTYIHNPAEGLFYSIYRDSVMLQHI